MTEPDPCQGCRHLRTYACPFQRPICARGANYGDARCRRERQAPQPPFVKGGRDRG